MLPLTIEKRLSSFLIFAGPAVTLAITPWFNYDPINLGKVLILTCLAGAGFGLLTPYLGALLARNGRALNISATLFVISLLLPLMFTDAPISQQIWGQFGRSTGIVTYVALLIIFFVASSLRTMKQAKHICNALIFTQIIMTIYCTLQILKKDPIKWSAYSTFGTLGNVNFLSGFMGISIVVSLVIAFSSGQKLVSRIALVTISLIDIFIVATTDSIQGLVALAVGISIYLAFLTWKLGKVIFFSYFVVFLALVFSLVLALIDKGPLRSLIYQITVIYRADYMNAGLKMMLHHPLTGIGIDSYDDWYRSERGVISAFRTAFNRTANTAHNVMLDLGSGGGFPLLISYLALLGIVTFAIVRGLKSTLVNNPIFLALVCSWVAYQVQAAVSINQVGVGIWGWLIGGTIISLQRSASNDQSISADFMKASNRSRFAGGVSSKRKLPNTPPPMAVVTSVLGLAIGFSISFIPLKSDLDFRSASAKGSLDQMLSITSGFPTKAFFIAQANETAIRNNFPDQAKVLNDRLISRFPRGIFGWQARLNLTVISSAEREEAIRQIKKLDPFLGLCADQNHVDEIIRLWSELPSEQQYELARGWGILPNPSVSAGSFRLTSVGNEHLRAKASYFCGG